MKRFFANPMVRGFGIIALIAFGVTALSLQSTLDTVGGLVRIAFYLAVAFFLFLVWRERRSDIDAWPDRVRRVFYGAIAVAVVDIGMLIGLSPSGPDAVVFVVVLIGCAYALWRVWRDQHHYV